MKTQVLFDSIRGFAHKLQIGIPLDVVVKAYAGILKEHNCSLPEILKAHDAIFLNPSTNLYSIAESGKFSTKSGQLRGALTAHIYYEDYADRLIKAWDSQNTYHHLFVSTPIPTLAKYLRSAFEKYGDTVQVIQSENRGRNFGPLFVDIAPKLINFDFFGHIHSKKTVHSPDAEFAKSWSDLGWELLLENHSRLQQAKTGLFAKNIALVYSAPPPSTSGLNYYWNSNIHEAERISRTLNFRPSLGRLFFPVGGMFLAKTQSLKNLLNLELHYQDFPVENQQVDGTLQHAIERLIGDFTISKKWGHLVYDSSDSSFVEVWKNKINGS